MTVSIITPSIDREQHLCLLYETILKQEGPWEWLICDSSFRPSPFFSKLKDKRVLYLYDKKNLRIGAKRNLLNEKAQGDYIAHFDDDDYYAPDYLSKIREELKEADFFKLTCFFCYSLPAQDFFYWDTIKQDCSSYVLSPTSGKKIREIDFSQKPSRSLVRKNMLGYGFSYSYRREVIQTIKFKNLNFKEDYYFINKVLKEKWKVSLATDEKGFVIHMLHDMNSSSCFPQYRLPHFISQKFFPDFKKFIRKYPKLIV